MKTVKYLSLLIASLLPLQFAQAAFRPAPIDALEFPERLTPAQLRCEYLVNPLGLSETQPRLSWIVQSRQRGQQQTAYRVLVAGTERNLHRNRGDLWDSGKVASAQTAHIEYDGRPLPSRQRCYWKVQVWDKDGKSSEWSEPALWTMGLLQEEDWRAQWIGTKRDYSPGELHLPPSPYLRKEFSAARNIRRALLYATACGLYEVHLNGERVGDDYFKPGWTDYHKRLYYNTYDVTNLLQEGDNAIGAILADGWYAGYIGFALFVNYPQVRAFYGEEPAFLAQLEIEYADGSRQTIVTDAGWNASTGPILESDMLMGEAYDARLEMPGWNRAGFDEAKWQAVTLMNPKHGPLESYPCEPVRRYSGLKPVSVTEPKPDTYIFDLGQNLAGWARLKVEGPAGTRIRLRFGEMLHQDGTLMTENLRRARATDTYILRGGGMEIWEPAFTYHGFQYVEVTGYPGRPGRDAITGIALTSATPGAGGFQSSNALVNQLYSNIRWTQMANFFDVPTDCPQRDERLGWLGDAQVYIRSASFNSDVAAFFKKWLVDVDDAQRPYGAYPDYAPWPYAHGKDFAPAWMDAGIICPYVIYRTYGDTRVIERNYDGMKRFMQWQLESSKDYLRPNDGNGWGDWLAFGAETSKDLIAAAYFAYDAKLMAEMAEAIGRAEDAASYSDLFDKIREEFTNAYISEDGRIDGHTQTAYVIALTMDLFPEHLRPKAGEHLLSLVREHDWKLATGFLGVKDILPVLTEMGHADVAYRLLTSTEFPSWGYSVVNGATTIWERWNSYTKEKGFENPGMNSFSHYAFGSVCQWMFTSMAGIDLKETGYSRIQIRPQIGGGIDYARARYDSIRGPIATHWRLLDEDVELQVLIPANTTAVVYLPVAEDGKVMESGRDAAESRGVKFLRRQDGSAVFEVQSGIYTFLSTGTRGIAKHEVD